LCLLVVVVVVESFFIVVSMFMLFMLPVSFFMLVSAGAGAMAGVVVVVDVESVMVELVSFVLQAATANRAATTTRRFIYDLLEKGQFDSSLQKHTSVRARTLRARIQPAESY